MDAQIIQFSTAARKAQTPSATCQISIKGGNPMVEDPADETFTAEIQPPARVRVEGGISETLKNRRLRDARKPDWNEAEAVCHYWKAFRQFTFALMAVQTRGLIEGKSQPVATYADEWNALAKWRLSIAAQLLTPAPDTRAIAWKKAALADGQWKWTDVTEDQIDRAIRADEAFLEAHPTRARGLMART